MLHKEVDARDVAAAALSIVVSEWGMRWSPSTAPDRIAPMTSGVGEEGISMNGAMIATAAQLEPVSIDMTAAAQEAVGRLTPADFFMSLLESRCVSAVAMAANVNLQTAQAGMGISPLRRGLALNCLALLRRGAPLKQASPAKR